MAEASQALVKVAVDFTTRFDGAVRARVEAASGPMLMGDRVIAYDADDMLCAQADVRELRDGFVLLDVDWTTQTDWTGLSAGIVFSPTHATEIQFTRNHVELERVELGRGFDGSSINARRLLISSDR